MTPLDEVEVAIKKIEKNHNFRVIARCDDGSAFFIPIDKENHPMGPPFELSKKKILDLAKLVPPWMKKKKK